MPLLLLLPLLPLLLVGFAASRVLGSVADALLQKLASLG
jgi:hypothetical protein